MYFIRQLLLAGIGLTLGACAVGPDYQRPQLAVPDTWQAPLPHGGKVDRLANWWAQFDDPLLAQLIAKAEQDSPTLALALARIGQSRADVAAARNALLPNLGLSAGETRSGGGNLPRQRLDKASLDAAWEIDLFGGARRGREAAAARQESAQAAWHDARVSLAAEVAQAYTGLRSCEALLADAEADLASRRVIETLTRKKVEAGFGAPADGSLAQASQAEAQIRAIAQRAECDISIKALVALTGIAEPDLRNRLQVRTGKLPQPAMLSVAGLPVQVISHRPDLVAAERDLAAASADIGSAEAARYPRLSLSGSIGVQYLNINGAGQNSSVWGFGPALDLPLFDSGRRAANADAAKSRYAAALATYKMKVRQAVSEVEQALVRLDSTASRAEQTKLTVAGYEASFRAAEDRWRAGMGSQLELEDFRRLLLNSRTQALAIQHEAVTAWIGLYRAVGGGWDAANEQNQ